jgi:hypothetical protein
MMEMSCIGKCLGLGAVIIGLSGCVAPQPNVAGQLPVNLETGQRGPVGIGIGGQDLAGLTDQMASEMMQAPVLAHASVPPQVIVDTEFFQNLSSQRINLNLITDRLRFGLSRASQGSIKFISRESYDMVAQERAKRRAGVVDKGTTGMTRAQAGADYRLIGKLNSLDEFSPSTGVQSRHTQISLELVDMESGVSVWQGIYELDRSAANDVVYR